MKIKFGNSGDSRDVETWMPGIPRGILDGQDSVLRVGITIKDHVVSHLRDIKSPVHLGFVVAWHGTEVRATNAHKTAKKIAGSKRIASRAPDHTSPSDSQFQEGERFKVEFLPVNKRSRDIRMAHEPTKELVDTDWSEVREKTRQAE